MNYDDDVSAVAPGSENAGYEEEEEEQEEEESRELTHNEIWDDSALIDAWDSAIAEYEVCYQPSCAVLFIDVSDRHIMAQAKSGKKSQ